MRSSLLGLGRRSSDGARTTGSTGHRDYHVVFGVALGIRLLAVLVTSATALNPYAHADADGFARSAAGIATTVGGGGFPTIVTSDVYDVWGLLLAPFWLLPGPSRLYARVGMAVLGAAAVYNVYVIARHHHSRRAGLVAALPLVLFPTVVFVHVTVLREAMVLFGLTTIARLLLAPAPNLGIAPKYGTILALLVVLTGLREENLSVYLIVLSAAAVIAMRPWRRYPATTRVVAAIGAIGGLVATVVYSGRILGRLFHLRGRRAEGRTEYLGSILPETLPQALAFGWIGAAYFLFAPFPWMVGRAIDLVAMVEGLMNLFYALAAVFGVRVLARRTLAGAVALLVGIVLGSVLYGYGTANVGTAVRHRPMVMWAIYLIGGVGIAHYLTVRTGGDNT